MTTPHRRLDTLRREIANQVAKRLNRRPRPLLLRVPLARIAGRIPTSTSFPSGHAASAAAFASAVALEIPALRVPLATLAGLVGFSRVATGAHYPSDVAAGFVLGATEVNPASHSGKGHDVLTRVQRDLPDISVIELTADDDVAQVMQRAATGAEVLGVAGRDGTVGAAAETALAAGIPLAVFPAGTFNHFAKALGLDRVDRAIRAGRKGTATKMDVAHVNDKLCLNTASVGAYSDFVARRQRLERRIGKPLAACYAALRTMRRSTSVDVLADDREHRATFVFIGNGQYQPVAWPRAFVSAWTTDCSTFAFSTCRTAGAGSAYRRRS